MTLTMHFDGALHVVVASLSACALSAPQRGRQGHAQAGEANQSFSHKQTVPPDKG
ncbi:MAG: hypothetical protein U0586_15900 [Candidatus Brocadiaceae bacterium]